MRIPGRSRTGVLALAGVLAATGCTGGPATRSAQPPQPSQPPRPAQAAPASCDGAVQRGALPTWARSGFTPADVPTDHVVGARGDIVGVVFGNPLHAPATAQGRSNKILWVARPEGPRNTDLTIEARLQGTGDAVTRTVRGGPGPSVVDVPRPGCWTFRLSWDGHVDEVAVPYQAS
ncbi:hypothetical protein Misp01_49990 [Microtetraspora sp. NBRC 13810]|uniref:hypothetical protein n=1 Tax=Microtetraspora sp. NBRC 13810 TaxID=3030990 RepID=UPI0024A48C91|nr:hypothetical protein [Microtetraspora sp. NBRC 13810]GLW09870.1 hypothetical protein Misp01_49990 [Microtetraspora sp. NBRC 13810]